MEKSHQVVLSQLRIYAKTANKEQSTKNYTGSNHKFYAVVVPKRREIIKQVQKNLSTEEALNLTGLLFKGDSHEEKTMAAMLLKQRVDVRQRVNFLLLDAWLNQLTGWAEIDALCTNVFSAEELLQNFKQWQQFICALAHDPNINKRRAALVFIVGPVAHSNDARLHALAFKLVKQLSKEKDILITKAISWLLRSQIDTKKSEVAKFIKQYDSELPKIALRDAQRKLLTGKKNK